MCHFRCTPPASAGIIPRAGDVPMKIPRVKLALLLVCLLTFAASAQRRMEPRVPSHPELLSIPAPPYTPKHPVTDEYYGIKVVDDYRWLENWDEPAVKQWSAAQNARTREYFDHLPLRPAIKDRLKQLLAQSSAAYFGLRYRAGMLFAQ